MFTQVNPRELPCPICCGSAFTWGGVAKMDHRSQELRFFSRQRGAIKRFFMIGGECLVSRKCNTCGHVDLFTEQTVTT